MTDSFRLETYRSKGTVASSMSSQLRCYFIQRCTFEEGVSTDESDIRKISDKIFLEKASDTTLEIYQNVINSVMERMGPVIEKFSVPNSKEVRLIIGYRFVHIFNLSFLRQRGSRSFFSALSDLYHYYDLFSTRKYVEQFANGVTILSCYLSQLPSSKSPPMDHSIYQVMKEASLLFCLPKTPLQSFFKAGKLSGIPLLPINASL
jgi:glutamate dehydrogenase